MPISVFRSALCAKRFANLQLRPLDYIRLRKERPANNRIFKETNKNEKMKICIFISF